VLAPRPPIQGVRNYANIFPSVSSTALSLGNQAEINEYLTAITPGGLPTQSDNGLSQILPRVPLSATLLDVNNQYGWYVLDTGEEQFLVRFIADTLASDVERLVFQDPGSANLFTRLSQPGLLPSVSQRSNRR